MEVNNYSLFDRFIDVEFFYQDGTLAHKLTTPRTGGLKPNISFTINMLPGHQCYQLILRIVNFNVPAPELRKLTKVDVTAGYLNKYNTITSVSTVTSVKLSCPIFSAYPETPNPDGVTVFNGLVVGEILDAFDNDVIDLHIYGSCTIGELITVISTQLNIYIDTSGLPDELIDYVVDEEQLQNAYATSTYALLYWMANTIHDIGAGMITHLDIRTSMYNNAVYLWDAKNPVYAKGELRVILERITKAYYTGVLLNVEAPWNPSVIPGKLINVNNKFYSAPDLFQGIAESIFTGIDNTYRVVTMTVSFGTVTDNNMKLLALPVQYAESEFGGETGASLRTSIDDRIKEETEYAKIYSEKGIIPAANHKQIILGTPEAIPIPQDSIWNVNWNGTYTSFLANTITQQPSSSIWLITAEKVYANMFRVLTEEDRIKVQQKLDEKGYEITVPPEWCLQPSYLWPLVLFATYKNTPPKERDNLFEYNHPGILKYYSLYQKISYVQGSETVLRDGADVLRRMVTYRKKMFGEDNTDMLITAAELEAISI